MTNQDSPNAHVPYDPASMATSSLSSQKVIWYRRPWVLITFVVAIVVAVSVITDLPHPISKSEDVSAQNASMKQINTDIAPCVYAVKEAFGFYRNSVAGTLTPQKLKVVNTYLPNDQTVCSFASAGMSDLTNNLQVLDTTAGKNIDKLLKVVVTWMDSDGNAAIVDIEYLINHPGDAKKIADLRKQQNYLTKDREIAIGYLNTASAILGTQLYSLNLPVLAPLPGT
ncbi:MAG: hypothetical protein HKL86_11000 [Acidimicrobiaceae bacterium]|nr:hypothetical protein [Acidimicrobiaceae bacterium]